MTTPLDAHHLNQVLEQKVQDLRALLDFVRGLTATLEPEDVARLLVLTLAGHWAVRRYAIAAWKEGHTTVLRQKGMELPTLESFKQVLANLPEACMVEELLEGETKEALRAQQGKLIFPIRSSSIDSNSVSGVVVVGPRPGNLSYAESDLEFGAGLVAQASVAFQ